MQPKIDRFHHHAPIPNISRVPNVPMTVLDHTAWRSVGKVATIQRDQPEMDQ